METLRHETPSARLLELFELLFGPLACCECSQGSLACLRIAVCWRAIGVQPKFHEKKRAACRCRRPSSDRRVANSVRAVAVAAEAEIEAGFHDVFGFIDALDESQSIVLNESEVTSTEVVVIVLNEARDEVGECILTADADCPPAAGIVQSPDDHPVAKVIFVALPSATALYIA
jgi:hypothetical protein